MKIARLLLLAVCLFAFSGATYYLDDAGGNDAWDGLYQTYTAPNHGPWQHISKVNGFRFAHGDHILFKRGGTWREKLVIPLSGAPNNPITFGAYASGNLPILDGELMRGTLLCNRSWIIIQDLHLKRSAAAGVLIQADRGRDLSHVTIQRLISQAAAKDGIAVMNNNNMAPGSIHPITFITIKGNASYDNGYHGIASNNDDVRSCVVSHNKVYNNGLHPVPAYGWHGISLYGENIDNKPQNCIIEHNEVYKQQEGIGSTSKEGAGIQCDDYSENIIVRYNKSFNNSGAGINLHIAKSIQVYGNIIAHNGNHNDYGDAGLFVNNSSQVNVKNNIFYNNDYYSVYIYCDSRKINSTRDVIMQNNIFYNNLNKTSQRAMRVWTDTGVIFPNFTSRHNCWFFNSLGKPMIEWLETGVITFAHYQNLSRQDQTPTSLEADPLFVDADHGNFQLRNYSPCLNKGVNINLGQKSDGKPRPTVQ